MKYALGQLFIISMVSGLPSESASTSIVITLLVIAIMVGIRIRRMKYGTKVSKARTIGYLGVLVALSVVIVGESFVSLGVSPLFLAPYALTVIASAFAGYRYTKKSLFFWRDAATGSIFVKGGAAIFAIYIAAMLARIAISLLFIGTGFSSFFASPTSQHAAFSSSTYYASITTDFLMMFGAGLFIGRNLRLYNRYSMILRGEESVAET